MSARLLGLRYICDGVSQLRCYRIPTSTTHVGRKVLCVPIAECKGATFCIVNNGIQDGVSQRWCKSATGGHVLVSNSSLVLGLRVNEYKYIKHP